MDKKYDVFISYSRTNLEQVKDIKALVEQQTEARCWMDLEGIESGVPRFTTAIIDGIKECQVLLFMRSAQSQRSEFALRELNFASKRGKKVVIVNVDNSPMTDEFEFLYGLTDTIEWENLPQREKLFRDVRRWLNKADKPAKQQRDTAKPAVQPAYSGDLLPEGASINGGKYIIKKVLPSSAYYNSYLANEAGGCQMVVKEFFIKDYTERVNGIVKVKDGYGDDIDIDKWKKAIFKHWGWQLHFSHPNVESLTEVFQENGTVYGVKNYIEGEDLWSYLRRTGRPLDENRVRKIGIQLMNALSYLHKASILHLDIKPGNIMIDIDLSKICLIDFDICRKMDEHDESDPLAYSAGYAPIEQIGNGRIGPHTDIYAAGATFYNLLTLLAPPSTMDIADDGEKAFKFPINVSRPMRDLIQKMMTPNRLHRITAEEVIRLLQS